MVEISMSPGFSSDLIDAPIRRYVQRIWISMSLFVPIMFLVGFGAGHGWFPGPLRYAAAIAAALPVLGVFIAIFLLMKEADEYIRAMTARSVIIAAGVVIVFLTVWGFLEALAGAPRFPLYWSAPLFAVVFGWANAALWQARP